jgi:hypothetical protein
MKLRALVRDRESLDRFLRHRNLRTEPLGLAEARPPPSREDRKDRDDTSVFLGTSPSGHKNSINSA